MSKVEKLRLIVDKVLTEAQEDNMILTMLKPILINFITQMKDDDVDKLINVIKAIIRYLEEDNIEGGKPDEEGKKVIPLSR